jgi:hypothetical protein
LEGRKETIDSIEKMLPDEYVLLQSDENNAVLDGLKNQRGRNADGKIFNVNTIGFRNAAVRPSPSIDAVFGGSSHDYVKNGVRDGFMVMAKAGTKTQALKLVLGVRDATANVNAILSDGSARVFDQTISAGAEERVFVVELPFRAAADGHCLMAKFTIAGSASDGEVSLKAVLLRTQ